MSSRPRRPSENPNRESPPSSAAPTSDTGLSRRTTNDDRTMFVATNRNGSVSSIRGHLNEERTTPTSSLESLGRFNSRDSPGQQAKLRRAHEARNRMREFLERRGILSAPPAPRLSAEHVRPERTPPPLPPPPRPPPIADSHGLNPGFLKYTPRSGPPPKRPPRSDEDGKPFEVASSVSKREERYGSGRRAFIYGFAEKE